MTPVRPPAKETLDRLRREHHPAPLDDAGARAASANPEVQREVDVDAELVHASRGQAHAAVARGVRALGAPLEPVTIPRREADAHDVVIAVEYCGLCHSDVHAARGEWGGRALPLVTGHEIVGRVIATGSDVILHRVGDRVGVGCLVASCRECEQCKAGQEMFCTQGSVGTYGAWDRFHGERTQGGYASSVVVAEDFVLRVPDELEPASVAPLLCAGITTYSPLMAAEVGPGTRVGVAGLGGLGHMAVKIAAAMGAEVTVFTRSQAKAADARELGADEVLLSTDTEQMKGAAGRFDVIIDAIAAPHDVNELLRCLRPGGRVVQVGLPPTGAEGSPPVDSALLVRNGLSLHGSKIGGIPETQEMLDFCAEHGFGADVEVVEAHQLNEAWDRMVAGDVRYRFVLDTTSLTD